MVQQGPPSMPWEGRGRPLQPPTTLLDERLPMQQTRKRGSAWNSVIDLPHKGIQTAVSLGTAAWASPGLVPAAAGRWDGQLGAAPSPGRLRLCEGRGLSVTLLAVHCANCRTVACINYPASAMSCLSRLIVCIRSCSVAVLRLNLKSLSLWKPHSAPRGGNIDFMG